MARPDAPAVLRLGTRGGALALWQAREAARLIAGAHPDLALDVQIIHTSGDRAPAAPLAELGGSGVFTREIEQALRARQIDIAIHSLKDLPTRLADDLRLAAVLERADPRDALVAPPGSRLAGLPPGARVGTSSPRRRAQLLARRPDLVVLDIRGNVPTRLAKLDRGEYDALVLAAAGLHRLGFERRIAEYLDPGVMMPAPGQGAIAIEARAGDEDVLSRLSGVDHEPTRLATTAERACLARLEGGCQVPVGVLAGWAPRRISVEAAVVSLDGTRAVRERMDSPVSTEGDARDAGEQLAVLLAQKGAADLLAAIRSSGPAGAGRENTGR